MRVSRFDFPDFELTRTSIHDLFHHLPTWAGNSALNFFLDSFKKEGFSDREFKAWKKRRQPIEGRNLLVGKGSGKLRRSLRVRIGADYFEVYTDMPYAQIHNEGGTIEQEITERQRKYFWAQYYREKKAGNTEKSNMFKRMALTKKASFTIKIPKRQFMGKSEKFNQKLLAHVERGIRNAIDRR